MSTIQLLQTFASLGTALMAIGLGWFAQLTNEPPTLRYTRAVKCGTQVLAWTEGSSELLVVTLPLDDVVDGKRSDFRLRGSLASGTSVRVIFVNRPPSMEVLCGDLGTHLQDEVASPDAVWIAHAGRVRGESRRARQAPIYRYAIRIEDLFLERADRSVPIRRRLIRFEAEEIGPFG